MMSKMKATSVAAVLFALAFGPSMVMAQDYSAVQSNGSLHLGAYGNFFIPGNLVNCPTIPPPGNNAQFCSGTTNPGLRMINQMYVQFMKPQAQNGKKSVPIAIVHGSS